MKDGEFARMMIKQREETCPIVSKFVASIKASVASGDIADSPIPVTLRALLMERLIWSLVMGSSLRRPQANSASDFSPKRNATS